jgi:hypothetical protein
MSDWLTYRQVRDALNELTDEQLDMTASVYEPSTNEVIPISECFVVENFPDAHQEELDGVVENDQPLFVIGPPEGLVGDTQ